MQVILEKIGGGGHEIMSGDPDFKNTNIEAVKELVKEAVQQYIEEAN